MYEKHFQLEGKPFSIAPDPRFLYMSQRHREALAHLLYGVGEGGGFVQLTGEVGTGKTTLCRALLEQLPDNVDVALILNPKVTAPELIATLCDELRVTYPAGTGSIKTLTDALNRYLLKAHSEGRRTVLLIDEAQNLAPEVLEQVRLLTNLETAREKLLQIILIGQPELRTLLEREDLRQLAQRVTARFHLQPMTHAETAAYVEHRLQVCGVSHHLFSRRALALVHRLSGGVPRLINVLCDRALLGGYVEGKEQVDARVVSRASAEVLPGGGAALSKRRWPWWAGAAAAVGVAAVSVAMVGPWYQVPNVATASVAQTAVDDGPVPVPVQAPASAEPAPVPVAAQEEDVSVELDRLLAQARTGEAGAWRSLLARWGVTPAAQGAPSCEQLSDRGLQCMHRSGSWHALQRFDRPALLYLMDHQARRATVALHRVDGAQALVVAGEERFHVPVAALERLWYGEYSLIWKALPSGQPVLKPGDRGAGVLWLRQLLGVADGEVPELFDGDLRAAVQDFQRRHVLEADGLVGARTMIHLNSLSAQPDIPRLRHQAS